MMFIKINKSLAFFSIICSIIFITFFQFKFITQANVIDGGGGGCTPNTYQSCTISIPFGCKTEVCPGRQVCYPNGTWSDCYDIAGDDCPDCTGSGCTGKQCGTNDCGCSCGTCLSGYECNSSYQCVETTCPSGTSHHPGYCQDGVCTPSSFKPDCSADNCARCPTCPSGQVYPHWECKGTSNCVQVESCGVDSGCKTNIDVCKNQCPTGQTNPHEECLYSDIEKRYTCQCVWTCGASNCVCGTPCTCTPPSTTTTIRPPSTCDVSLLANPNPIPYGQNTTKLDYHNVSSSCTLKRESDGLVIPTTLEEHYLPGIGIMVHNVATVRQDNPIEKYTVSCTCQGELAGATVSASVIVRRNMFLVDLTINGIKGDPYGTDTRGQPKTIVYVALNTPVELKATTQYGVLPIQKYYWSIGEISSTVGVKQIVCYLTNPKDGASFINCEGELTSPPMQTTNTIYYQWNKEDYYPVQVEVTDNNNYSVLSNTIVVRVTKTVPTTTTTTTEPPPSVCNLTLTAKPLRIILGQDLNLIWSVGDNCDKDTCQATVTPETGGNWSGNPYDLPTTKLDTPALTYNTTSVKPTKADTYTYTLQCDGKNAETIAGVANIDVRVIPLPFWREIIPNLQGFLRGLVR